MTVVLPETSTEYLYVTVTGPEPDLTALAVEMAVVRTGTAVADGDWTTAEWAQDRADAVRILVGPNSDRALATGRYSVWVRVSSAPESPVRKAGEISVVAAL